MSSDHLIHLPSYWMREGAQTVQAVLDEDIACDVAVVGAGLTGLSIAFHFKSRFPKLDVRVFEAGMIGSGASGSSGGIIVDHPDLFGSKMDSRYLRDFLNANLINCDLETRSDYPCQFLLNPWKLTLGISSLCGHSGVQIYEGTWVSNIDLHNTTLVANSFRVSANLMFLATDANGSLLNDFVKDNLETTIQNCIVVHLHTDSNAEIPWVFYFETGSGNYVWGRRLGNRKFLFGNEEKPIFSRQMSESEVKDDLLRSLQSYLPDFNNCGVVSIWTGMVGKFRGQNRQIVQLDTDSKCFYIGGYDGYGIAAAVRSGSVACAIVNGEEAPNDFQLTVAVRQRRDSA